MKSMVLQIIFLLPSLVFAQVSGNAHYQDRTVPLDNTAKASPDDESFLVSVKGLLNAEPEYFVASFHLTQIGETAGTTDSLMSHRIQLFRHALGRNLSDSIRLTTDVISFVPKYNVHIINRIFSKTYHEVPDGFELKKNIMIRYRKAETIDYLVNAAASAEIYDLVKVDYFISDVKAQYQKLREQSISLLQEKLTALELLGLKLDNYQKTIADDFSTLIPSVRYGSYQAVSRPAYDAVKVSTTNGKHRITETGHSTFYDAVTMDEFDFVINPVVDRPKIQLTYALTIKFFVPAERENNLLLITPSGQIQKLDQLQGN